jgi:hypothetical protein
MGKRMRLKIEEIEYLGLQVKKNNQYYLGAKKLKKLYKYKGYSDVLVDHCIKKNINPNNVRQYWDKEKNISVSVFPQLDDLNRLKEDILEEISKFKPKFPKIKRNKVSNGHLLVVDPADIHIGKLAKAIETGEEYNSQIAVQRVKEGVQGILDKSSGFNIDKILFVGGNDILHIDTPKRTTTSGTPQDTDGMWYENFIIAKQLYVEILLMLLDVADVHFVFNPSNHDYTNGFFLADVIKTYFKDCKNITFDCSISHRKYYKYGKNLIGTTHGDGAKQQDLPLLMAQESGEWSSTKHRYVYMHHFHHKISKDYIGVTVESLRSPSGSDSWHHRKGYVHAPKAVEGFIHCKDNGQICRITHIF